jgi:hypothetical protein
MKMNFHNIMTNKKYVNSSQIFLYDKVSKRNKLFTTCTGHPFSSNETYLIPTLTQLPYLRHRGDTEYAYKQILFYFVC